ncbi:MAG: type II toxin-antitoxin system VapC family toxin [Synechocystis sp.]
MKILIDTHIFLWFILEDDRLNFKLFDLLEADHDVFISVASLWEIAIKSSINKFQFPEPFHPFIQEQVKINDFEILEINYDHLNLVAKLDFYHRDPFDRLMISQAIVEEMPVVSLDSQFKQYPI